MLSESVWPVRQPPKMRQISPVVLKTERLCHVHAQVVGSVFSSTWRIMIGAVGIQPQCDVTHVTNIAPVCLGKYLQLREDLIRVGPHALAGVGAVLFRQHEPEQVTAQCVPWLSVEASKGLAKWDVRCPRVDLRPIHLLDQGDQ